MPGNVAHIEEGRSLFPMLSLMFKLTAGGGNSEVRWNLGWCLRKAFGEPAYLRDSRLMTGFTAMEY